MKNMFDVVDLHGLTLKNRIVRSATGEALAGANGSIPPDLFQIYRELGEGGTGLVILSFTSVAPVDHFREGLLRLHSESPLADYERLATMLHSYGAKVMPQLALGIYLKKGVRGNYAEMNLNAIGEDDIENIIDMFVGAARRAREVGFDGVQLHGCHGFVLSRFLSSQYNRRHDPYGGSADGRARIVCRIISAIKQQSPGFHVSIKLNGSEMPDGDLLSLVRVLADAGLDSVEYEGLYSPVVNCIKTDAGLPVILTGGHRDAVAVNQIVAQTEIDAIGMARPLIREPNLPARWEAGELAPAACRSCGLCMTTYGYRCAFLPTSRPALRKR